MRQHYYLTDKNQLMRITGERKPCRTNKTFIVRELIKGEFVLPGFPEVTYGQILNWVYIGSVNHQEDWELTKEYCS